MSIEIYLPKPHEGQIAAWTAAIGTLPRGMLWSSLG